MNPREVYFESKILSTTLNFMYLWDLCVKFPFLDLDTVLIILIIALFFDLLTLVILIAGVLGSDETAWKGRLLAGIVSAFISGEFYKKFRTVRK